MNYNELQYKYQRIALLKEKLSSNPNWATAGCQRIYEYQTADEQNTDTTRELNGVGFSGCDAEILSSFAKQLNAGRTMSQPQMDILFRKMPKYAKQLDVIAQAQRPADATEAVRSPDEEDPNRGNKS